MDNQPLTKKQRRALRRQERLNQQLASKRKINAGKIFFWLIILAIIGATVWGAVYLAKKNPNPTTPGELGTVPEILAGDHGKGNINAELTLIEYSDFQCPACAAYYPMVKQLVEEYKDQILFAYRHFPLSSIHKNATLAAQAAEAAGLQKKFWDMHDLLFENQASWSAQLRPTKTFISYASQLGLDTVKFEADLTSAEVIKQVEKDYESGLAAGINATPTFALNNKIIANPRSLEEFRTLIDQAILPSVQ